MKSQVSPCPKNRPCSTMLPPGGSRQAETDPTHNMGATAQAGAGGAGSPPNRRVLPMWERGRESRGPAAMPMADRLTNRLLAQVRSFLATNMAT